MTKPEPSPSSFSIANFTILPSQNLILSGNEPLAITPKMVSVLIVLANRQGETISKDDIMSKVWGDVVVSDMVLSRAISDLRKVFGDSASQQSVIETVSKKGYRLKLPVVWLKTSTSDKKHSHKDTERRSSKTLQNIVLLLGFLISGFIILKFFWPLDSPKILTLKKTNISTDDAIERRVRFSPDGKYVIYDSQKRLILRSLKDNSPIEISQELGEPEKYKYITGVFSPNGKQIAFRRLKGKSCDIHLFNFIERKVKYLANCTRVSSNGMDWSPNGNFIITTELDLDKRIEYVVKIDIPTGEKTVIAEPKMSSAGYLFPRVSPDNKYISVLHYRKFEDQWGIAIINLENGQYKEIFSSYEKINQIVWRNKRSLFYVIDGENGVDAGIWEINIDSGQRSLILNADIRDLDYNRKTHQFAYTQNQKHSTIWVAHKEDNAYVDQPLLDSAFQSTEPRLSPDEQFLAYISQRSGSGSLWLRDLTSEKDIQIYTIQHAELTDISWSPDNAYLLVTSLTRKGNEIHKLKVSDRSIETIKSSHSIIKARWGQNNKEIYIYEKRDTQWQIVKHNLDNKMKPILLDKPIRHYYVVSNNNHFFYQPLALNKLFKKSFSSDNNKKELIAKNILDWAVSGDNILISRWNRQEKTLDFNYYNLKENSRTDIGSLKLDSFANVSWQRPSLNITRDSQKIYFVKTKRTHSDIVLVSFE